MSQHCVWRAHITCVNLLRPQKKHTVIFLFSLLLFASTQKQERKGMVISVIAVGVQITKRSAVRRANVWEKKKKKESQCSYLAFSAGTSLQSQTQRSQAAKPKAKSPQTRTGHLGMNGSSAWVSATYIGNQRTYLDTVHKRHTPLE